MTTIQFRGCMEKFTQQSQVTESRSALRIQRKTPSPEEKAPQKHKDPRSNWYLGLTRFLQTAITRDSKLIAVPVGHVLTRWDLQPSNFRNSLGFARLICVWHLAPWSSANASENSVWTIASCTARESFINVTLGAWDWLMLQCEFLNLQDPFHQSLHCVEPTC